MGTYLVRCAETGREQQARHGKLRRDLASVIAERLPGAGLELAPGRLVVEIADAGEPALDVLAGLPGVASVSPCRRVAYGDVLAAVLDVARPLAPGATFAVRVRRSGGKHGASADVRTPDITRQLAGAVAEATGARTDLERPDVAIGVELRGDHAFVFDRIVDGVDRVGPTAPRFAGEPRFVADQMLGRLAARLRLLGYDTITVHDIADSEVTRLAAADGRTLLTRDGPLAQTRAVPVHRVAAGATRAQLVEVLGALALAPDPARYFTRCTLCNTVVEPVAEAAIADRIPAGVRGRGLAFSRCPGCEQVYWRGAQVERVLAELDEAIEQSHPDRGMRQFGA